MFSKICKALNDYAVATDMPVYLVDARGAVVFSAKNENPCALCASLGAEHIKNCPKVFRYGCMEAHRFGGRYIFFCSMGLVFWATPILKDNVLVYGAVCGPVMMVELDEFVYYELETKIKTHGQHSPQLLEALAKVRKVEPNRVTALSEQLFYTGAFLCTGDNGWYFDADSRNENQARVSEYIHYIKSLSADFQQECYPLDKEKELMGYILDCDRERSGALLNEILGHILFKSGDDIQVIKARALELVVMLSRAAIDGGGDARRIFGWNYKYINEISRFERVDHLVDWLNGVLKRFNEEVFDNVDIKHADAIYKARRYIKTKYMEKLTLEEVARFVHFSPSYFSKIFSEETGGTFKSHLNEVRVENSKKLLLESDVSLTDVANMMGFEDQSYYSKVFKKVVGVTPGKFREKRGR